MGYEQGLRRRGLYVIVSCSAFQAPAVNFFSREKLVLPTPRPIRRWSGFTNEQKQRIWQRVSSPQLFAISFLILILVGTVGFKVLPGLYTGQELSWLDALFTAASAVCVTGLTVVDTATYFTFWGQLWIMLLIQVGGLGILTFTSLIITSLGKRISLRQEEYSATLANLTPNINPQRLVRRVVLFTLGLEGIGALLLFFFWRDEFSTLQALWIAVFHSISAFCNAGFSTFSDSLMSYDDHVGVMTVIMVLIALGGIGFLTLDETYLWAKARRKRARFVMSLQSRLVLASTLILIIGGAALFWMLEHEFAFAGQSVVQKVTNAFFMSISARTAGFNTIDYTLTADSTNYFTILLMSIGGAPGSLAGGLKTTTVAVLLLLAWSRFRGQHHVSIWSRTIPQETINRATHVALVGFVLVTAAVFVYTLTEEPYNLATPRHFIALMFEAASAFNTVGLTMGLTPELSPVGKMVTILGMFLGRVGPLTVGAAVVFSQVGSRTFRYAHEDIVVG